MVSFDIPDVPQGSEGAADILRAAGLVIILMLLVHECGELVMS